MIAQGRYDVIVLDVMMPDVDGFEVLRSLRARWSKLELPVLMATALDASKDVVEALRHGANDYVTKPVDFEQLQARIETQLALRQEFAAMRNEAVLGAGGNHDGSSGADYVRARIPFLPVHHHATPAVNDRHSRPDGRAGHGHEHRRAGHRLWL